jgi:hypothetical protein
MPVRVTTNGCGRTDPTFRAAPQQPADIDLVAINDVMTPERSRIAAARRTIPVRRRERGRRAPRRRPRCRDAQAAGGCTGVVSAGSTRPGVRGITMTG